MQYLTIWDLILTPIYLVILIAIAKNQRDKRYPIGHPLRKYYMPGLYVKFGGAIFIGLIYQFYYGGGDTFNFFYHMKIINSSLNDSFSTWFKLIINSSPNNAPEIYAYSSQMYWYTNKGEYIVASIGAVFGVLNGTSYMPIALLFAFFSYTGIWAMYRTFANIYPMLYKPLAYAFLFIPSTFVWGSGIFKDTLCMFGLGWMTYTTFRIFVNRDFSIRNIFLLILSFLLIGNVKMYILLAFLPALSLWLMMTYSKLIRSTGLRWVANLAFIGVTIAGFLFFSKQFAKEMNKYSLENIATTAASTRGWITYIGDVYEGSTYDLGEFEPTINGMLSKFPQAVVVTLFRPFLWEVRKPIVALSALEALAMLYFTLNVFIGKGAFSFNRIARDPNLIFFLVFSLLFAFAVGISTGNFGTLSRYKIPCLPFYGALLLILYYQGSAPTQKQKPNAAVRQRPVYHLP